jgi:hypothetical protein
MQISTDIEFYAQRERQERQLADRSQCSDGRRVHLELARCYAQLIAESEDDGDEAMASPGHA